MPYFNGTLHGSYMGRAGYVPAQRTTAIYCDGCAETRIPLPPETAENRGRRHWETGFKWCHWYGGDTACTACGQPVDRRAG